MARYRGIVVSDRTAEETFDYMAEFSNGAEWDPGVAEAERLDEGAVGLGSRFRLGVRVGGRTTPLDYEIVSYERPHRVVLVAANSFVRSEDTITVVRRPAGGSVLTYEAELTFTGALSRVSGLLALPFRRIGDRGLGGLRRVLSAGSAPVPSPPRAVELAAAAVDELLEATVVGSFSSIGPAVRSRLAGWRTPPSLDGRVVLITGATSGLGLATAIGVARLGATVRLVGRSRERAQQAVTTVTGAAPGADVGFLLADMGELDQVREMAAEFSSGHARLDVARAQRRGPVQAVHRHRCRHRAHRGQPAGGPVPADRPTPAGVAGRPALPGHPGLLRWDVHAAVRPRGAGDGPGRLRRHRGLRQGQAGPTGPHARVGPPSRRHGGRLPRHASRAGPTPRASGPGSRVSPG